MRGWISEGKRNVEGSKDKEDGKSNELGSATVTCGRAEGTELMGESEAGFKGRRPNDEGATAEMNSAEDWKLKSGGGDRARAEGQRW